MTDFKNLPDGSILHDPGNTHTIEELWAFLSMDPEGHEGICGFISGRLMIPLITAEVERLPALKEHAQRVAEKSGKMVRLVKFTRTEVLEVIVWEPET